MDDPDPPIPEPADAGIGPGPDEDMGVAQEDVGTDAMFGGDAGVDPNPGDGCPVTPCFCEAVPCDHQSQISQAPILGTYSGHPFWRVFLVAVQSVTVVSPVAP